MLREALDDPTAVLALRLPGRPSWSSCPATRSTRPARARAPVIRHGQEIAVLFPRAVDCAAPAPVRAVLGAASLTIELARLQVELRRRLAEVEVSRARLVHAGDEERRRLERDLHDGAQQRLVGLGIRLRRIQRSLPGRRGCPHRRSTRPSPTCARHRRPADDRGGLRPSGLDDGLAAALASWPARPRCGSRSPRRGAPAGAIEAAAYYVACEAVTNAVKHASPSTIRIDAGATTARCVS